MKKMIASVLMLVSLSAMAECQREAQFIGKIRNVSHSAELTSFQVKLTRWFQPSIVCPMDEIEAEDATILLPGWVDLEEGQEVSGVLVYKTETGKYVIE